MPALPQRNLIVEQRQVALGKYFMRSVLQVTGCAVLTTVVLTASSAVGKGPRAQLWSQFQTTRQASPGLHQEFDVTNKFKSQHGVQATVRKLIIDLSQNKWREKWAWQQTDVPGYRRPVVSQLVCPSGACPSWGGHSR